MNIIYTLNLHTDRLRSYHSTTGEKRHTNGAHLMHKRKQLTCSDAVGVDDIQGGPQHLSHRSGTGTPSKVNFSFHNVEHLSNHLSNHLSYPKKGTIRGTGISGRGRLTRRPMKIWVSDQWSINENTSTFRVPSNIECCNS